MAAKNTKDSSTAAADEHPVECTHSQHSDAPTLILARTGGLPVLVTLSLRVRPFPDHQPIHRKQMVSFCYLVIAAIDDASFVDERTNGEIGKKSPHVERIATMMRLINISGLSAVLRKDGR